MLVSPNKIILLLLLLAANSFASATVLQGVRIHEAPDSTRVVFDTSLLVEYEVFSLDNPNRIVVDLIGVKPESGFDPSVVAMGRARISDIRTSQRGDTYRLVIDTKQKLLPEAFALKPIKPYGHRLVVDLLASVKTPVKPSIPVAKNRDVIIAIDAGHGGDDPGAIGPKRIQEKRVVLQIAKRIAKKINAITGFTAVLVRTGDYYLPHRKRTQIARQKRADLFLSIHADAFKHANVRGASVYTLSDRGASSETAAWLAERENRSDLLGGVGNVSLTDKDVVLAHVLLDLSMDANRLQSIEMGEAILASMGRITKLHKRTVEQAAFVVLKSPDMPSILVETGFISNPQEAKRLSQAEHQDKIARAISTGVEQFMRISPPPGTLLASRVGEMRYTIVRGDTLSRIAQQYGVSSRALKSKNGLRSDSIRVGQVIVIPTGG